MKPRHADGLTELQQEVDRVEDVHLPPLGVGLMCISLCSLGLRCLAAQFLSIADAWLPFGQADFTVAHVKSTRRELSPFDIGLFHLCYFKDYGYTCW